MGMAFESESPADSLWREYGSLFATVNMVITAGNLVGPLIFGYLYNSTGSYNSMLAVCAVLFAVGAGMVLMLGRYPTFEREVVR